MAHNFHHASIAHLGLGIDGEGSPESTIQNLLHRLFVAVIHDDLRRVKAMFQTNIHAAGCSSLFVAVRGVDHDGQVELFGQVQLQAKVLSFTSVMSS